MLNRDIRRSETGVLRCSLIVLSNVSRAFIGHFKEVHGSIDDQFVFLFLLLLELADVFWSAATAKIAPAVLRSEHVQYSSEEAHCGQERENDGWANDEGKLLECDQLASEESRASQECRHSAAENTNSHLLESLFCFCRSVSRLRVLVVLSKVNNVVNGQTNQYNYCDRFRDAKLPALINHDGDDAHKDNGYADNWPNCQQHVAWYDGENDKCKDECYQYTLQSWLDESLFRNYPSEVKSSCEFTTLHTLRSIHNVFSHELLPLFVNGVQIWVCVPLFSDWGRVYFKIHKLTILDFQDSLCFKESSNGWLNKSNKFILKFLWLEWQLFVVNSDCFCIISHTDRVPYTWLFSFFIFLSDVLVKNLNPTVNLPWGNKSLVSEILAKL